MPLANLFKRIRKDVKQAEETSEEEKADASKNTVIKTGGTSSAKQIVDSVKEETTNVGNLESFDNVGQIPEVTQVQKGDVDCENLTAKNAAKSTENNGVETAGTDGVEVAESNDNAKNSGELDPSRTESDAKCVVTVQRKPNETDPVKSTSDTEHVVIDEVKLIGIESVEFTSDIKHVVANEIKLDEMQQAKLISDAEVTVQAKKDEIKQASIISHVEMAVPSKIDGTKTAEIISDPNNSEADPNKIDELKQIEKSLNTECSVTYQTKKCELEPAGLFTKEESSVKVFNETRQFDVETSKDNFTNINNASSKIQSEQAESISDDSVTTSVTEIAITGRNMTHEKSVEGNIEAKLNGVETNYIEPASLSESENTNTECNTAQCNTSQTDEAQKNQTTQRDDSSSNESNNLKEPSCATGQCPDVQETQPTCELPLSKNEFLKSDVANELYEPYATKKNSDAVEHHLSIAKLINTVDETVRNEEITVEEFDSISTKQLLSNNIVNEVPNSRISNCDEQKLESSVPHIIKSEPRTKGELPTKGCNAEIASGNDNPSAESRTELLISNTNCQNQVSISCVANANLQEPQTKIDQISAEKDGFCDKPAAPNIDESVLEISIINKECIQKSDSQFNDENSVKEKIENETKESLHSENSSNDAIDLKISDQDETSGLMKNSNSTASLEETNKFQDREGHILCLDEKPCEESRDDKLKGETMVNASSEPPDIEEVTSESEELFRKESRAVIDDLLERIEKAYSEAKLKEGKEGGENEPIIAFEEPILNTVNSSASLVDSELVEDETSEQCLPPRQDTQNWKVGYLQVKLPAKSRKAKLKAWQKRWVVIQADEFTSDSKNRSLVLSIYHSESGNSRSHNAAFWKSVCAKSAVVYRSMSRTHPYAFTIAEGDQPIVNLSSESESTTQEWMAAIRAILWPPSPVMQLEKVLNGNEFEVSIIDTDFSYRAGLLGTYGYMSVTNKKLILSNPQLGHVIQEWYLNTVDKFQILPQPKEEDVNKVLVMHTSRDSSTGQGEIKIFCNEAVDFLKSVASTIHKVLQYHSRTRGECYRKELDELADWLTPQPSPNISRTVITEDYYKVPPRQVRSLLDIPNFIFDLPTKMVLVSDVINSRSAGNSPAAKLKPSTTTVSAFSNDSGISMTAPSDDSLNISSDTSFSIGNRTIRKRDRMSSTSESSDGGSPAASPEVQKRPLANPEEAAET